MLGFEIGRLSLQQSLERIDDLKDIAVFPLDEGGQIIREDAGAHESAREIRLLLQRVLDLDTRRFLEKMRELFFHLFSVDHEHYRDLLMQAAMKEPEATRDFCLSFLFSEDVIFIDDQKNLLDLFDVLTEIGVHNIPDVFLSQVHALLEEPFFRRPSLHARTIRFLAPVLQHNDLESIRRLYEMDLIPRQQLPWAEIVQMFTASNVSGVNFSEPQPKPEAHLHRLQPEDLEDLRWGVGLEGVPLQIVFRYLGCMVAAGPEATELFYLVSERLPESAFSRRYFETRGHQLALEQGLRLLREDILRDVHHSGEWFTEVSEEIFNPAGLPVPQTPWPASLRFLPTFWMEFANPTDGSDFALDAATEIMAGDQLIQRLTTVMSKHSLPSTEELAEGQEVLRQFLQVWESLLTKARPHLDVIP